MMTQQEAGKSAGMAGSYIGLIEMGQRRPYPEKLRALAKALQVPPREFLEAADYELADDDVEIPLEITASVRRLVAHGLTVQDMQRLEKFAEEFLLHRMAANSP
jgi:transcriptional regulator with XRE-family HTH domain